MHRQQVPTAPPWPGPIPIFICASFHPFLSTESTHYRPQTNHPKATIARRIILLFLPLFLLQFFTNFQPLSNTNIHYSYLPSTTTLTNSTTILSPPTPTSRIPPSQISTNKSTINTYQFLRKINPTKHLDQLNSLISSNSTIAELNAALIEWMTTANDMTGLNDDHP